MKIQCDVCSKDEASVFCTADEAALCDACDHRVHHANKLAGKHQRFSLLHPSPKQFPLCDVCQEKMAFLFCQQDRAILCRDCDLPIHRTNEHTQKHSRFLLTGVKLSPTSALYSSSSSSANDGGGGVVPNLRSQNSINKPISAQPSIPNAKALAITSTDKGLEGNQVTSSISEYLIETLPGWRVEDFLDSFPASLGFSKSVDDILPNWNADLETNLGSFSSPQKTGIWVPQAPPPPPPCPSQHPSSNVTTFGNGSQISLKESMETTTNKSGMKYRGDGYFTVPQISLPSTTVSKKRSRTLW